jgi:biopolymer transport protein ExbD
MKTASSRDKYELVTEINMIPFIDVSLVLLIIFMVMTPFLVKEQIKIDLPHTKSVNTPVDEHRLLQVDVTRDGAIYVDGTSVTADGAYEAIRSRLTDAENQPVVIAADRDVAFEHVVVVMDAAKRCGAKRLGVSVKHDGDSHGSSSKDVAEPKSRGSDASSGKAPPRSSAGSVDKAKPRGSAASSGSSKHGATRPGNTATKK